MWRPSQSSLPIRASLLVLGLHNSRKPLDGTGFVACCHPSRQSLSFRGFKTGAEVRGPYDLAVKSSRMLRIAMAQATVSSTVVKTRKSAVSASRFSYPGKGKAGGVTLTQV
jgi:hypothetical protein